MFTKKFNNLSDSLIEAAAKTLANPIVKEASNETPTINHLELSEEELNELSPAALQKYKAASTERMKDQSVVGKQLQKRQTGYSTAVKKLSGDAKVRAKEPEKKTEPSFGVKVGKITPKTPNIMSQKGGSSMPMKAAASPMKEEEEAELSPKQKKIAQVSHPKDKIDSSDLAKLRAGHKIDEAKRGRKSKGDDDEEGPHYDEREDPETGEITKVKDTVAPKKHIMNQLRQAAQSMKAQHPVTYANGKTHNVPKHVAKALVNSYQDPNKKPNEKEAMQAKIGQSHDALMKHHSQMNEDSYEPKNKGKMLLEPDASKKNKKELDEVPVETMKQVKMVNQEEMHDDGEPPFTPDKKKVNWKDSKQSRAKWLAKTAMEKMKKNSMKEEEDVKPGAQYAKKVSIPEEVKEEQIVEREMSSDEKAKREKIVMALKKKMAGFKERYGKRAKDVMYATATKQAMKEEETSDGPKDSVKINPPMSTKEGIGIKSTTT